MDRTCAFCSLNAYVRIGACGNSKLCGKYVRWFLCFALFFFSPHPHSIPFSCCIIAYGIWQGLCASGSNFFFYSVFMRKFFVRFFSVFTFTHAYIRSRLHSFYIFFFWFVAAVVVSWHDIFHAYQLWFRLVGDAEKNHFKCKTVIYRVVPPNNVYISGFWFHISSYDGKHVFVPKCDLISNRPAQPYF